MPITTDHVLCVSLCVSVCVYVLLSLYRFFFFMQYMHYHDYHYVIMYHICSPCACTLDNKSFVFCPIPYGEELVNKIEIEIVFGYLLSLIDDMIHRSASLIRETTHASNHLVCFMFLVK